MTDQTVDLFQLGQKYFNAFIKEFASYGLEADPGIELRRGSGMLCYYDLEERHIYLSVPDLSQPTGKLQALFLGSMLGSENSEELIRFLHMFIPRVIVHELAHHYRHRYGLFSDNLWEEEQIANKLAVAVFKHRLSPPEKAFAKKFLRRAIKALSARMEAENIAVDSYYSMLHTLNVSGQIGVADFENVELMHALFAVEPEEMLKASGQLSADLMQRLDQRDELIEDINDQYASDQIRYIYYHVGWLYLDLTSRETEYIQEFSRAYLNLTQELLPVIPPPAVAPEMEAIQACYQAYRQTMLRSRSAGRYFYKRYRSLLLDRLQTIELPSPTQTERLRKVAPLVLENWEEEETDTLNYLSQLVPPPLRLLFPHHIDNHMETEKEPPPLPTDTDARLWEHVMYRTEDKAAAQTLYRLSMLDQSDIYRPLPVELLLELIHQFYFVKYETDEPIIWEEERNDDVYFLMKGKLKVSIKREGAESQIGTINPGEIFGEMAFFTEAPRSATIRAIEPSQCLVLKNFDLQLFAFKHPAMLMQMARVLAHRLADFYHSTPIVNHPIP